MDHTYLKNAQLTHFPNLEKMSHIIENKDVFHPGNYCAHLDKVETEFNQRFKELDVMECIAAFVSNPFMPIDVEQVAAKFQEVFALSSGVDMELIDLICCFTVLWYIVTVFLGCINLKVLKQVNQSISHS